MNIASLPIGRVDDDRLTLKAGGSDCSAPFTELHDAGRNGIALAPV